MTAKTKKKRFTEKEWKKRVSFAFIRNPWDRVVSWFLFCKQLKEYKKYYNVSFKRWVLLGCRTHWECSNVKFVGSHPLNLYEYIYDDNNKILVTFVGKFEKLQNDFNNICDIIGSVKSKLPHVYKTKNKGYRQFYDTFTKNYIRKKFEKDIDLFNYTF